MSNTTSNKPLPQPRPTIITMPLHSSDILPIIINPDEEPEAMPTERCHGSPNQEGDRISEMRKRVTYHKGEVYRLEKVIGKLDVCVSKTKATLDAARVHRDSLKALLAAIDADYSAHRSFVEVVNNQASEDNSLGSIPFEFDPKAYASDLVSIEEAIEFISIRTLQEQHDLNTYRTTLTLEKSYLANSRQALSELEAAYTPSTRTPSSLYKVPDELWSDIWELLLEDELESWRKGSKFFWYNSTAPEVAARVAGVCKNWRRIAIATPKIWSFLFLRSGQYIDDVRRKDYFKLYVERSRSRPLEITLVQYDSHTELAEKYLETVKRRGISKLDLCFSTTLPTIQQRACLIDGMDIDQLSVSYRNQYEPYPIPETARVRKLHCADFRPQLEAPNQYLTELKLDYCSSLPYSLGELMERAPELDKLELVSFNFDRMLTVPPPEIKFQHDSLRHLALPLDKLDQIILTLGSFVSTPNLTHINILDLKGWNETCWESLCCVDGLGSRIKTLSLKADIEDVDLDLRGMFTPLKSLTSLELKGDASSLVLGKLESSIGQGEALCPKLGELRIVDYRFDGAKVLNFVREWNARVGGGKIEGIRRVDFFGCPKVSTNIRTLIARACV